MKVRVLQRKTHTEGSERVGDCGMNMMAVTWKVTRDLEKFTPLRY